jgi:hypothetical protein
MPWSTAGVLNLTAGPAARARLAEAGRPVIGVDLHDAEIEAGPALDASSDDDLETHRYSSRPAPLRTSSGG